jgi:predicted DNA-binding protein
MANRNYGVAVSAHVPLEWAAEIDALTTKDMTRSSVIREFIEQGLERARKRDV